MSYLIDTCALSEVVKAKPDSRVIEWFETAPSDSLFISTLTLGEIRKGVEKLPTGTRRTCIETWLENDLPDWFRGRILSVDIAVADEWGRLMANAIRTLPTVDALIAATATRHRLSIVTRNAVDFADAGVTVINPWDGR